MFTRGVRAAIPLLPVRIERTIGPLFHRLIDSRGEKAQKLDVLHCSFRAIKFEPSATMPVAEPAKHSNFRHPRCS